MQLEEAAGGDYICEQLAFASARVSVMSGQDPLLCTVVEVEGDRAEVHYDGSGEFEDRWLLKSSTRLGSGEADMPHVDVESEGGIDDRFACVGARVSLTRLKESPLPSTVVAEVDGDRVKSHYDGSGEFQDECMPENPTLINPKEVDIPFAEVASRDDVGDQFDSVGAKITVASGQGYPLPCTVVEVEEDRVKVHYDGFGSFRDEWLPKSSTRIQSNETGTPQTDGVRDDVAVQVDFAFVGAQVSVMSGKGYPLPATVVGVEGNKVKIHYDGFGDFRDEWLPTGSERISSL